MKKMIGSRDVSVTLAHRRIKNVGLAYTTVHDTCPEKLNGIKILDREIKMSLDRNLSERLHFYCVDIMFHYRYPET